MGCLVVQGLECGEGFRGVVGESPEPSRCPGQCSRRGGPQIDARVRLRPAASQRINHRRPTRAPSAAQGSGAAGCDRKSNEEVGSKGRWGLDPRRGEGGRAVSCFGVPLFTGSKNFWMQLSEFQADCNQTPPACALASIRRPLIGQAVVSNQAPKLWPGSVAERGKSTELLAIRRSMADSLRPKRLASDPPRRKRGSRPWAELTI
jgi:hypothetical protein